jgi:hypothetical protein
MPQLYVFLHGLMTLYEGPTRIRIYLPNVTPVHVFRAGDWFAETELRPRTQPYPLTGLKDPPHADTINWKGNTHLGSVPLAATAPSVTHSIIDIEHRPSAVRPLRSTPVNPATDFTGGHAGRVAKATKLPSGCLLVFETDDASKVRLEGHDWKPLLPVAALHIFAEEDSPTKATIKHAMDGFHDMIKGLFGLDIGLTNPQQAPHFDPLQDKLPDDVDRLETDDLAERLDRLAAFGSIIRQQMPKVRQLGSRASADDLKPFLEPFREAFAIGTKMGSCSQVSAQEP